MTGTIDTDHVELSVSRDFAARADQVFAAFLDLYDDPLPDWIEESALDLRVGGHWDLVFHPPGLERFRENRVITELDRPRRLAYIARFDGAGDVRETRVVLTFEASGGTTTMSLKQAGLPNQQT